jgi:hypothetical protein
MSPQGTAAYDGLVPGTDLPHVAVRPGDWREIYRAAPFDQARMHWLTHPDLAALVATRRFP